VIGGTSVSFIYAAVIDENDLQSLVSGIVFLIYRFLCFLLSHQTGIIYLSLTCFWSYASLFAPTFPLTTFGHMLHCIFLVIHHVFTPYLHPHMAQGHSSCTKPFSNFFLAICHSFAKLSPLVGHLWYPAG
jgi:hypothetical protein